MDHDCEGGGREVPGDPPPNEAATCPVCGRATPVEPQETDGVNFTIAPHQKIVDESG